MYEKKLDYAGLKKAAPSPHDIAEFESRPLFERLGKVTVSKDAPDWIVFVFVQVGAQPHTVLTT